MEKELKWFTIVIGDFYATDCSMWLEYGNAKKEYRIDSPAWTILSMLNVGDCGLVIAPHTTKGELLTRVWETMDGDLI